MLYFPGRTIHIQTPANGFDSGILASGKTFTHNFHTDGIIQYYCNLHPTMLGEIIVVIFYLIISFLVDTFRQLPFPVYM